MADKITELETKIKEQDKQIKKLVASAILSEKRMMALDKKLAREHHTVRNITNQMNQILRTLHKGGG